MPASLLYTMDASRCQRLKAYYSLLALDLSLYAGTARATDVCLLTSPWQHIMSMRIRW
jgi:hypothetical protein